MECAIQYTNANHNPTALVSLSTWEVMLKAAKIRSYAPILNLVISELNGYPVAVKYHLKCYQSFTHNLHLERLLKKSEQIQLQDKRNNDKLRAKLEETEMYIISPETTTWYSSSSSKENLPSGSCHLLTNKCIFCDKEVNYVKRKREFLRKYAVEQAKGNILHHAKEKNDFHLIALS